MLGGNNNPTSRRAVLKGIVGGVAGASLAPLTRVSLAAAAEVTRVSVARDLTVLSGAGGNIAVLATGAGQVVVDSGAAASSAAVLAALGDLPGGRVAKVFNTHWHLDQVGSNEALGSAGATIVAHAKTRQRLSAGYYLPLEERYEKPMPKAALPTEAFYTDGATKVGDAPIEYGYLIEAHTDGDIFVAFPELNVIVVGDIVAPVRDPVFDWFGGGWLGGRIDALALLLERSDKDTRFVPSYGPVVGRAELEKEHGIMVKLFDQMIEHVRLGENAREIVDAGVLGDLGRTFEDPYKLIYDVHKGFWAHHNKLMPDVV
jgi:glyoxylase-like metal-dependent hydrolase (beta-lactamase superfamily II)